MFKYVLIKEKNLETITMTLDFIRDELNGNKIVLIVKGLNHTTFRFIRWMAEQRGLKIIGHGVRGGLVIRKATVMDKAKDRIIGYLNSGVTGWN